MKHELISTLSELVSLPTVEDNPQAMDACFEVIRQKLAFYPFIVREYQKNGKKSFVWLTQDTFTPDLMLNAHIDVVPAPQEMFRLTQEGTKLYGRGVADMKFSIASFVTALKSIYNSQKSLPSVGIMVTSDEEKGGMNGVNYLVNEVGYHPKVVIIPDGGKNNHIVINSKGVLALKLSAAGVSAHASSPFEGDNAIDKLITCLNRIRKVYPQSRTNTWQTTLNIGTISGGTQSNQVPDSANSVIDIRFTPTDSPERIFKKIEKLSVDCKVEKLVHAQPFHASPDDPEISRWAKLINPKAGNDIFVNENGASDARFFNPKRTTVILSGPEYGSIHHPGEWLSLPSFEDYTCSLINFIQG